MAYKRYALRIWNIYAGLILSVILIYIINKRKCPYSLTRNQTTAQTTRPTDLKLVTQVQVSTMSCHKTHIKVSLI